METLLPALQLLRLSIAASQLIQILILLLPTLLLWLLLQLILLLRTEGSSADHVINTAGCAYDNVDTVGQTMQVLTYCSAPNASLTVSIHVVSQRDHHLLNL